MLMSARRAASSLWMRATVRCSASLAGALVRRAYGEVGIELRLHLLQLAAQPGMNLQKFVGKGVDLAGRRRGHTGATLRKTQ